MEHHLHVDTRKDKAEAYEEFLPQLRALLHGETDETAIMANAAAALRQAFQFFWVGFYRVRGKRLVLGPFQGSVACSSIGMGKGVCGTAWKTASTQLVADVEQFPGHIACSSLSKSEIVVPIVCQGTVTAVLDIDSDRLNAFDETDRRCLERVAATIAEALYSRPSTPSDTSDTICALATAPGGALGIVRVSGPGAFGALSSVCREHIPTLPANTVHHAHIVNAKGETIDQVMVSVFRAPHTYTGEDSVEISCHGSHYILNTVLGLLIQNGCRMAEPGEFTKRAYLNGKMDLSQAEAVADLIASTNRATHHLAISQLRGHLSSHLAQLREQLLRLTSLLELELDFSDHEDLEFADRSELLTLTQAIEAHIDHLAHTFEAGQAIKQGIPIAIVGKTNVGKSTLLNRLLGDDRAIVSDIHGTTRDTIEDIKEINGVQFRFIDTAGIRQTTDAIEQIGIDRTFAAIEKARTVLWLIDEWPAEEEIENMKGRVAGKQLIIAYNKADLDIVRQRLGLDLPPERWPYGEAMPFSHHSIEISAKEGKNIDALESLIYETANLPELKENDAIVTNARHYDALVRAHAALQPVLDGLGATHNSQLSPLNSQLPPDLLAEDLRQVLDTLAEITGGQITPQETLNNIFSHFCVGK